MRSVPTEATPVVEEILRAVPELDVVTKGEVDTFDYRVQASHKVKGELSMWHDIKLFPTEDAKTHNVVNMINEVTVFSYVLHIA